MSAPGGAELEEQRTARGVDLFAGWAGGLVEKGHGGRQQRAEGEEPGEFEIN